MKQQSSIRTNIKLNAKAKIAIVASRFNEEVCEGLLQGARQALTASGLKETQIQVYRVPGAVEIPLITQKCARSKKYKGIICLGAVIRGDTPHFEYVCQSVTDGLTRISLDFELPVGFGVLTVNTLEQAAERSGDDAWNKGREAALTVLEMAQLVASFK